MRGFLSGLIWGGVASALGLGVISELADGPGTTASGVASVATPSEAPAGTSAGKAGTAGEATTASAPQTGAEPGLAASGDAPAAEAAPSAEATAEPSDTGTDTDTAEGEPARRDPLLDSAPEVAPEVAAMAPEAPAAPDSALALPAAPGGADDAPEAADPTRVAEPDTSDNAPALADLPPPPPLTPEEEAMLAELQKAAEAAEAERLAAAEAAKAAGLVPVPAEVPDAGVEIDIAALPPGALPEPAPEPAPEGNAAAPAEAPAEASPEPAPEPAPPATSGASAAPKPQPGFSGQVAGVTTGRLPSIAPETEAPATEAPAATAEANADQPPLTRFAAAFEAPQGKPLFSVVLVDPGGPDVDRAALADLNLPVTIAIDPLAADAAMAAELYRAAGKEVVMLATGIPGGATPADLETTFQAHAATLPEAVAVMDLEQGGFQGNRPLATQVVPVIAGQGRGLLSWDKGLNAGDQEARRSGLAAARIFRRLDGADEAAPVIRRYLDRAAFKAAQDGAVVVAGEVRPETVQALTEWAIEGRAGSVALAPLSALLRRGP